MPVYTIEYVFLGNLLLGYCAVTFAAHLLNLKISFGKKLMFTTVGACVTVVYLCWPRISIKILALVLFFAFLYPLAQSSTQTLKLAQSILIAYFLLNGAYQALILQGYRPELLIFLGIFLLILGNFAYSQYQKISRLKKYSFLLEIAYAGKIAQLKSYLDTGNTLRDPYLGWPVLVVEYQAVKNILPKDFLTSGIARKIPFRAVDKKQGYLWGFIPDSLKISQDGQTIVVKKAVVAVTFYRLAGDFQALLAEELLKSVERRKTG